jgi:DNA-binding FrmR family transcriptional regulator
MGDIKEDNNMEEKHKHQHQDTKKVLDRMSRAIGHMESIKRMIEDGRDCSEVLIQLSAVRSAVNNVGKIILQDHISNCVVDAVETGDKKVLEDLNNAVDKFTRSSSTRSKAGG